MPVELLKVTSKMNSAFFSGRLSIGCYLLANSKVVLFDSGIDDAGAKAIEKACKAQALTPVAIINSHGHADHCGGNAYLQKAFPHIKTYATKFEKAFIENADLEPSCFCKTAEPFHEFTGKITKSKESRVDFSIEPYQDQEVTIEEASFKVITLPGHTKGMIGIITPENILYSGDAIFGDETFSKHGILFYTNIAETLNTFKKLQQLNLDGAVLYHGGHIEHVASLAQAHATKIEQTAQIILDMVISASPISMENLLKSVMKQFNIPENVVQYTLTETCVNAYLQHFQAQKMISLSVENGVLVTQHLKAEPSSSSLKMKKVVTH